MVFLGIFSLLVQLRRNVLVSHTSLNENEKSRPLTSVNLTTSSVSRQAKVLGADANFMDKDFARELGLGCIPLDRQI